MSIPTEARTLDDAKQLAALARDAFGRDYPAALYPVQLAQWALESARGAADCGGARNYFGMKARTGDPAVVRQTGEHINGKDVRVADAFRRFETAAACFIAHARLLTYGEPYAPARLRRNDPVAFARALQGVYATDPKYGDKLVSTMRALGLIPAPAAG